MDNIPDAVRVYPASAGTIMMPLTPANNWTATIMFCGGANVATNQSVNIVSFPHKSGPHLFFRWVDPNWIITTTLTSPSCVKITPDFSTSYVEDDPLPEGRSMGSLVFLPNGKIICINGAALGMSKCHIRNKDLNDRSRDCRIWQPILGYWEFVWRWPAFGPRDL